MTDPVRGPASDSLAQALAVADRLRPQEQQLVEASKTAFVDAVDSSYLVMAAIVGVAAIVIPALCARTRRQAAARGAAAEESPNGYGRLSRNTGMVRPIFAVFSR